MKRTQVLACISLLLDDEEEDENDYPKQKITIWVKPWLQRRGEQGIYNNLFQELLLEDKKSFKDYIGSQQTTLDFVYIIQLA